MNPYFDSSSAVLVLPSAQIYPWLDAPLNGVALQKALGLNAEIAILAVACLCCRKAEDLKSFLPFYVLKSLQV